MLTVFMLTFLNLANPFHAEQTGPAPVKYNTAARALGHPVLANEGLVQVRKSSYAYLGRSVGVSPLRLSGATFDKIDAESTHWHLGPFDRPPQVILDLLTMTKFQVSIRVTLPWGDQYIDNATLERGQNRIDSDTSVTLPVDAAELDRQCVYYGQDGRPAREFRHPSWNLLSNPSDRTQGGFNPAAWTSFGDVNRSYGPEDFSSSRQFRLFWTLSNTVSYHAGLGAWRAPVYIRAEAHEYETPEAIPQTRWFEASEYLADEETIGQAAFEALGGLDSSGIDVGTYRPFPAQPEIRFTPLRFVEDFLPFERP